MATFMVTPPVQVGGEKEAEEGGERGTREEGESYLHQLCLSDLLLLSVQDKIDREKMRRKTGKEISDIKHRYSGFSAWLLGYQLQPTTQNGVARGQEVGRGEKAGEDGGQSGSAEGQRSDCQGQG